MEDLYRLDSKEKKEVMSLLGEGVKQEEIFRYGNPINGGLMSICPNPTNNKAYKLTYADDEADIR